MRLLSDLKINMRLNEPLAQYTSFKIGGLAHFFARPQNLTELLYILKYKNSEDLPLYILGGGANTLFSDRGFPGLVLNMSDFEKKHISIDGTRVHVSAGVSLHQFALALRDAGLGGLEFLAHLPGTVGGALTMNAGFGKDEKGKLNAISTPLIEVSILDESGNFRRLKKEEIHFEYRHSDLGENLILEAVFELAPRDPEMTQRTMDENYRYRRSVQDWTLPSAGSVFKNPKNAEFPVGKMVDMLGLKGTQIGGAKISDIHGNFIVNTGNARAQDVLELIELIRGRVRSRFQVELETEIKYVGE